ncbi:hypothetical protein NliqN6_1891 [Naganishia liquefaciens]|uniref:Uncharacterized protein n=1 Tax=Naganishia liquefaciens TaxID=104408 RepID=A0A8H3TSL5_9TREE|nr:hypothetical protein NliqN6_1891 [Naganishia liquefaciens]
MSAIYSVFTSPHHAPMPNHLPTLIITPHGQPHQILYSYLHTEFNSVNYLLTPSPQGDLCVAKLFPPNRARPGQLSDSGHSTSRNNVVKCEASRDLRWTIENTGIRSPIYKIVNSDDTPLYQISKPNPNADFWTMFYFAYAGHQIPPKRVEFGKISKNPPEKGGGTRITVTGKTEDEKKVWQTLGEGNEDCVEWVIACACLNLLDDEIIKAAEKKAMGAGPASTGAGPASTAPPATSPSVSRPVASTLQASAARANPVRSSPSLPPSQSARSGIPHPGHGSRPASAEPSTRNAYPSGPRMPGGSSMGGQRSSGPQPIHTDPRYQQQRAGYGPPPPNSAGPGIPQYHDPRRAGSSPQPQHQRPQQSYGSSPGPQQPYPASSAHPHQQHQQQQQSRMMYRPQQAPTAQRGRF